MDIEADSIMELIEKLRLNKFNVLPDKTMDNVKSNFVGTIKVSTEMFQRYLHWHEHGKKSAHSNIIKYKILRLV